MNIIFDLDGTLIDSKLRLYTLFCYLVPQAKITFDEYWAYKFSGKSNFDILKSEYGFDSYQLNQFHSDWMNLIEHPDYLALDTLLPGARDFLSSLQSKAEVYLCTARQHNDRTMMQLELLGLKVFFNKILVTQQKQTKSELILTEIHGVSANDWIIGDMGKDILTGKELGINTCAVLTGFMTKEKLISYEPDLLIQDLTMFEVTNKK